MVDAEHPGKIPKNTLPSKRVLPNSNTADSRQAVALGWESIQQTDDGPLLLSEQVLAQPSERRREYARQIVDLWFNINAPIRFPTEGEDADWLESESARRIVKRKMVEQIMEAAEQIAAKQG